MQLNKQQEKAVAFKDGYSFITSCPGSGKTRVLTERTIKLLNDGVFPENILCITFTNKAANEMKSRIEKVVGPHITKRLWVSTFHSMGAKILRNEVVELKPHYKANFTILDASDQETILKKGAESICLKTKSNKDKSGVDIGMVLSKINYKKDTLQSDDEFAEKNDINVCQLYKFYKDYLKSNNCMDFGDLLCVTYRLLLKRDHVRNKYSDRFHYIMVDECQDLNYCQYEVVKLLSKNHNNLMLIGDCDQSIYRFRQADPTNVLSFVKECQADTIALSLNYRSTKNILDCASTLINHNTNRISEKLYTINDFGDNVKVYGFSYSLQEEDWIANQIKTLVKDKYSYKDIAILYRTNIMSRGIEQKLRYSKIPCKVVNGSGFFEYVVVKLCINYLRFYANPKNSIAFNKIVNCPRRSIADEMVNRLSEYCVNNNCTLMEALSNLDYINIKSIGGKRKEELKKFFKIMSVNEENDTSLIKIAERIFKDSGLYEYIENISNTTQPGDVVRGISSALDIYSSFMTMVKEWSAGESGDINEFLEYINLQTDTDDIKDENKVKLMTMHSAKGLEFPVVIIAGADNGIIPHKYALTSDDPDDIEEERRLFYVAITRAQDKLFITQSQCRPSYNGPIYYDKSMFLNEIHKSKYVDFVYMDNNFK